MLGAVVRDLHTHPMLTRQMIADAINEYSDLSGSNLAGEIEKVKFTPAPLSLDELSKLWSVLFQTPHALSIVYQASVLLIDAGETPRAPKLVREPEVYGIPFRNPVIERVKAEGPAVYPIGGQWPDNSLIDIESTLIVEGKNFQGDQTTLLLDGREMALSDAQVTDSRISLPLKTLKLPAGAHSLQLIQSIKLETGLHRIVQSNVVAFLLRPIIDVPDHAGNSLTITYHTAVNKTQRVSVLLYQSGDQIDLQLQYLVDAPSNNGIGEDGKDTLSITFPIASVKAGMYLVRSQVDGAESLYKIDKDGKYVEPVFTKK